MYRGASRTKERLELSRPTSAALAAVAAAALLAGCGGKVIDDQKVEGELKQQLTGPLARIASVDCPSDVEVHAGDTFDCTVETTGGKTKTIGLKIVDDEGTVRPIVGGPHG